jgi:hypothetical protein
MARKNLKSYKIVNLVMDPEKHKQFKDACTFHQKNMNQVLTEWVDVTIKSAITLKE